ncbi:hypothetical protein [Kitasatospora acidiphila]|uniref:hypothetical protein n=1 Tax=Kitasatospora acidiphila TaxID=2567942 RepID=UPI003C73BE0D
MTPDDLFLTVFGSTAGGIGIYATLVWRHASKNQAVIRNVLAWSAAQRTQQPTEGGATPPDGREPAPEPASAPVVHLATVTDITTRTHRAA